MKTKNELLADCSAAMEETKRFAARLKLAHQVIRDDGFRTSDKSQHVAAMKRSSMDLSRVLAKLRNS